MSTYPPPPVLPGPSPAPGPFPPRTNGLALASLIVSVAGFCVLFVGGLAGVILGLVALRRARDPQVGGRGMATAGIAIGILSILTSVIGSVGIYYGTRAAVRASEPPRRAGRQFVQDLNRGDTAAAAQDVTPNITPAELQTFATKLHALGPMKDMTSNQINTNSMNGITTWTLSGIANFATGDQAYTLTLTRSGEQWKVSAATFP